MTYYVDLIANEGEDFTSSNLDVLGYDRETETLYIEFQSGSSVYAYRGVKESVYNLMLAAKSVGSFYSTHIKGNSDYPSEMVGHDLIDVRSERDEVRPEQGEVKWVTNPGGDRPIFDGKEFPAPTAIPERYAVTWVAENMGPFSPTFMALNEDDAINIFKSHLSQTFGDSLVPTIKAVTHYFD